MRIELTKSAKRLKHSEPAVSVLAYDQKLDSNGTFAVHRHNGSFCAPHEARLSMLNSRSFARLIMALSVVLTSCSSANVPVAAAGAQGAPTIAKQVPADFPVPVYPGSRVFSVDKMGPITMVGFTHKDSAKVLSQWYQAELPKRGWTFEPVAPREKPTNDITLVARNGKKAVTIGLYPSYYPNGEAHYTLTLQ
jgi:hypothetical protein